MFKSVLLASTLLTTAYAQADDWQYEVTPYLWGAANDGSTGKLDATDAGDDLISDIDLNFQDILDHLEAAWMMNANAKKGDLLLFGELIFLDVHDDQESKSSNGVVNLDVDIDITGYIVDLAAGYRLFHTNDLNLYGYGGARYFDIDADIETKVNSAIPALESLGKQSVGDDWIDPIVGLHSSWQINDAFYLSGRLEASGFGVGSDETYMVNATLDHSLSDAWSMKYFYRYLNVNYEDDGFLYDMKVTGPGVGVSYSF